MKARPLLLHLWPRTLFHRLVLILCSSLLAGHALNFWLILHERAHAAEVTLAANLANDVATSVALLEHLPPIERATWLGQLQHGSYRYVLGTGSERGIISSQQSRDWTAPVANALGPRYAVTASAPLNAADPVQLRIHLQLTDGTPLTVELFAFYAPHSLWVPVILGVQLLLLAIFTWVAVRLATRPLAQLANAADALDPDVRSAPLPEDGPLEVARAATAFNAMQRRIADYLAERIHILAAVSHDLQTPITRLRLRAELIDNTAQREKMLGDLSAMQALVEQGIAYARSAHEVSEAPCRTDLDALLDSLVCDYADAGQPVRLHGSFGLPLMTRPHTLRRIIINLVDNALKFGSDTEILIEPESPERLVIIVRDRGPGIPPAKLKAVMQPFYRIENSRNRESGGTGLGLAIAQQLMLVLGGSLHLSNRDGGGLEARVSLPTAWPNMK